MKSAIFYGKHDLRIEDAPPPRVNPQDVLIRVKACGVCGTDVHIYEGDKGAAEVTPPTILGHEFSGVVEAVGSEVCGVSVGDRVCVDPNCYCGKCEFCRDGIAHFCTDMIGYGTTVNGGFAELCAVNCRQVYKLGDNTTFEMGAMAEPVACCLHGIDMCNIHAGDTALVIGGGMIGLLMMQLAKLCGAARVVLLEPVESKRDVAKKLGADLCINPIDEDVRAVLAANNIGRIACVIECVGRTSTIEQAIDLVANKGTVMMFGLTKPDDTIALKPFTVFQKEIELKSSFINPYTQRRALELIDSGRLDVSSMVYKVSGLCELEEILSSPEMRAKGKFIISPEI